MLITGEMLSFNPFIAHNSITVSDLLLHCRYSEEIISAEYSPIRVYYSISSLAANPNESSKVKNLPPERISFTGGKYY